MVPVVQGVMAPKVDGESAHDLGLVHAAAMFGICWFQVFSACLSDACVPHTGSGWVWVCFWGANAWVRLRRKGPDTVAQAHH